MGYRSVRHPHYETPERFVRLAETAVEKLVEFHRDQGLKTVPPGQYLLLHSVNSGDYHIPLLVHVKRGYSGPEAFVHPLPLRKDVAEALKRRGVHTPYGVRSLELLERALASEVISPESVVDSLIIGRIGTRRARRQYPPLPEYPDLYVANRILQEVAPDTELYRIRNGSVFVFDYHVRDGDVQANIERYDRKKHGSVSLKTVWPEGFDPVAHLDSRSFRDIVRRVLARGRQVHL